jgi:LacI family transcriptional regulator
MEGNVSNIKELAGRLGLSVTTVSRVLNGKAAAHRISEATSLRVTSAAAEYGYSVNRIARGLKLERTETIGLIVPDISNPFFALVAKTIELEVRSLGYSLILCDSQDDPGSEKELLELLAGRKVDGIILAPVGISCDHVCHFRKRKIPVVAIDRYFPGSEIPYVTCDNFLGAYMATEYLIKSGHRRIACIHGPEGVSSSQDRLGGYTRALKKFRIRMKHQLIGGNDFGEENGYLQTLRLLKLKQRPTAIFALGNLISLGVLRAIKDSGLCIPKDISLVTFDEQPYSAYLQSPMTTIEQPREEIARRAVRLLTEAIATGEAIDSKIGIHLAPRLIVRDSVKNMKPFNKPT